MKRTILTLSFVIVAMIATAQQIAVVTGNSTKLCQTLADAIEEASSGSTIYLPGGGFQISDDVKITKKVSIIGIGHKAVSENVDGNTVIVGNLNFNEGSSNSVVMGCYISGDVRIGYDEKSVNNILIQYCNLNSVQVHNNTCSGTTVNQNYLRNASYFGGGQAEITNNIIHSVRSITGGVINYNNFTSYFNSSYRSNYVFYYVYNSTIAYNILYGNENYEYHFMIGGDNYISDNMVRYGDWGERCTNLTLQSMNDVFVNFNNGAIDPSSDFHFSETYSQYEGQVGIYGGTGFLEGALPPVPYIVSKFIPEQTDASGKLNIKIRVKAGE